MLNTIRFITENAELNVIEALEKAYKLGQENERFKIDETIAQLEEEKEFAYADFEEYNTEVLSYDDTDVCERDACYIGMARAIEILKRNHSYLL